jgi:hypothetical protein
MAVAASEVFRFKRGKKEAGAGQESPWMGQKLRNKTALISDLAPRDLNAAQIFHFC